jgi:23S rRNA maturation mini-RNase III
MATIDEYTGGYRFGSLLGLVATVLGQNEVILQNQARIIATLENKSIEEVSKGFPAELERANDKYRQVMTEIVQREKNAKPKSQRRSTRGADNS